MEIVSRGPVAVASLLWERSATWVLTVVCAATFEIVPGEAVLQSSPEPLLENDIPWDAPYARSIRTPTDLVPVKANVDVLLTGHACAPGGRPARSLVARLAVGSIDKSIEVFPDRYFDPAGTLVEGRPFTHMPLVYERAAGGPSTWNPAGVVVGQRDAHGNVSLPNLLPPKTPVLSPDRLHIAPVGFGALRADWPSRVQKLGGRTPRELPPRWNGQSLPDDIARDYFNAAPADQQMENLRADESITLENLHASHPSLSFRLPGIRPIATLEGRSAPAMITLRCDTLRIDTDRGTCTLVWRGHLPLRQSQEMGRLVVALDAPEYAKRHPTFAGAERESDGTETIAASLETTLTTSALGPAAALPFAPSAPSPPRPSAQSSSSWNEITSPPARDPLSQSASSWGTPAPMAPPPRASSPSLHDVPPVPPLVAPAPSPLAPVARDALSQSASSWDTPVPPPAPVPLPPPVGASAASASPWAASAPTVGEPVRQTVGMAAAAGALAIAEPRREPLLEQEAPSAETAQEPVQILWFNPDSMARIRRVPRWKEHLDEFNRQPIDRDLDDPDGGKETWEIEDHRELFEVLTRGAQSDARGVEEALAGATRDGGKLVPPLVLLAVDVEMPFDELEALRAAANAAAPLVTVADEGLRAAVEAADKFLGRPGLSAAPAVSEGLHVRIREAFAREKKALPADYLEAQTERALLAGRHYQKREVFGETFLRALLWLPGEKGALVGYVPEALGKKLPMYRRFRGRVIAEVHPQQDQYEGRRQALRVVAVGRSNGVERG